MAVTRKKQLKCHSIRVLFYLAHLKQFSFLEIVTYITTDLEPLETAHDTYGMSILHNSKGIQY